MLLLEANQLEKYWRDRLIYKQEQSLRLYRGDRLGIVGRNGSGKTTLLHTLAGLLQPDAGTVKRYGECTLLAAFEDWEKESHLSGGEMTKRKLESALLAGSPILLADEPTSHMDLNGIRRVEGELSRYDGLVVLVSHDRELLDKVCTHILELEEGKLTLYSGGYSSYREQKALEADQAQFAYEQYAKEKDRLSSAIREKKARAVGMRKPPKRMGVKEARLGSEKAGQKQAKVQGAAQALITRLENLAKVEKPKELPEVRFDINGFKPIHGRVAIRLAEVTKLVGGRLLISGLSATIRPGDKVALLGANGSGKTTLLDMIRSGEEGTALSRGARLGYFHQTLALLDEQRTVLENVTEESPYPESFIRTVLARLLFRREEVLKPVAVLSGGEKVKTALAKVFLSGCNLMLLDEPSNYLDIGAREELEEVLAAYPGTILFASHDRRLIKNVANKLLVFEGEGAVRWFDGTYETLNDRQNEQLPKPGPDLGSEGVVRQEEERLQVELELAEVIGRLSVPRKTDDTAAMESRYLELLKRKKELNEESASN